MEIINIGICLDNIDPKGLGRIRCAVYNESTSKKERSIEYSVWDDRDPFLASPFLPLNINFVPEIGQSVKILTYNTEKTSQNQEYIAGPFTNGFDFNSQTLSQQIGNTTFGTSTKKQPDVINSNGKFRNPKSENSFAKHTDFGVYGKYGSDIIFTENGLQLRGGKLQSKDSVKSNKKIELLDSPIMAKKSSKLQLKKFPKQMSLFNVEVETIKIDSTRLNYVVEYDVDNIIAPSLVNFYVYKVNSEPLGTKLYQTDYFTEQSELYYSGVTLQKIENTDITTFQIPVVSIKTAYQEIRFILQVLEDGGLNAVNSLFNIKDIHPFYFRPRISFRTSGTTNIEHTNIETIIENVKVRRIGPGNGLIWSSLSPSPPSKKVKETKTVSKLDTNSSEQTFGSITSDKIFLISTDTNETEKTIDFDKLDKYEYTQEDYISKIEPNSYASVRGENLLNLLNAMINVLQSHVHNINKPYARQDYPEHNRLMELFKKMENDLLNNSIRIN